MCPGLESTARLRPSHRPCSPQARLGNTFVDGTSNTAIYAERMAGCGGVAVGWLNDEPHPDSPVFGFNDWWTGQLRPDTPQVRPSRDECNPQAVQSHHRGVVLAGVADGSVRGLTPAVSVEVWRRMVLPADGEVLTWD